MVRPAGTRPAASHFQLQLVSPTALAQGLLAFVLGQRSTQQICRVARSPWTRGGHGEVASFFLFW